ncbi:hypothetical protein IGI66_000323 [Enterococcus sp. AZ048]|uniref:GH25 family lysozyme n=1 Tax=Enterococcus sp. AZ048 TaxID=2774658 RepID=UPI003F200752
MKKKKRWVSILLLLGLFPVGNIAAEENSPVDENTKYSEQQQVTDQAQKDGLDQATVKQQNEQAQASVQSNVEQAKKTAEEKDPEADPNLISGEDEAGSYYLPAGTEHSDLQKANQGKVANFFALELYSLPSVSAADANLPSKSFVDVASYNGNVSVADFQKMKAYGVRGVVVKLTEGTSYQNPYAATQIANAKAAGLKVSAYHYAWFTSDASARAEANYFASYASQLGLSSSTVMVNDIEAPTIRNQGNHTNDSASFANQLNRMGYGNVRHYASLGWFNEGLLDAHALGNKNIWVAAYPYSLSAKNFYTEYGAWQWSSLVSFPNVNGTFDVSADYTGIFQSDPTPIGTEAMYRVYNPNSGEHFYTRDSNEKNTLLQAGWRYEGVAWDAPQSGAPVYRMYNPNAGDHHYTLDAAERDNLKRAGWRYEGISWYSGGTQPLYRLYNPNAKTGTHHYTLNTNERDHLKQVGWRYEGIAWYGK